MLAALRAAKKSDTLCDPPWQTRLRESPNKTYSSAYSLPLLQTPISMIRYTSTRS